MRSCTSHHHKIPSTVQYNLIYVPLWLRNIELAQKYKQHLWLSQDLTNPFSQGKEQPLLNNKENRKRRPLPTKASHSLPSKTSLQILLYPLDLDQTDLSHLNLRTSSAPGWHGAISRSPTQRPGGVQLKSLLLRSVDTSDSRLEWHRRPHEKWEVFSAVLGGVWTIWGIGFEETWVVFWWLRLILSSGPVYGIQAFECFSESFGEEWVLLCSQSLLWDSLHWNHLLVFLEVSLKFMKQLLTSFSKLSPGWQGLRDPPLLDPSSLVKK